MLLIFPSIPYHPKQVDPSFKDEYLAAKDVGFKVSLLDIDSLDQIRHVSTMVKLHLNKDYKGPAMLRSWMMKNVEYHLLREALQEKGIELINSSKGYNFCHELPNNLATIESVTPKTLVIPGFVLRWIIPGETANFIQYTLKDLAYKSLILKDYVKSEKHYWKEACFIPDPTDHKKLMSVINRFRELRGGRYSGGLVFREFIKFEGYSEGEDLPKINEHRIFILNRKPIFTDQYWGGAAANEKPNPKEFAHIISQIPSNFYSMDVARTQEGKWMIIELGDGQVAGLPEKTDPQVFYRALKQSICSKESA